jgi:hypothetical protein
MMRHGVSPEMALLGQLNCIEELLSQPLPVEIGAQAAGLVVQPPVGDPHQDVTFGALPQARPAAVILIEQLPGQAQEDSLTMLWEADDSTRVESALPMKCRATFVVAITNRDKWLIQPSLGVRQHGERGDILHRLFEEDEGEVRMDGREFARCVAHNSKPGVRADLSSVLVMDGGWGSPRLSWLIDHCGDGRGRCAVGAINEGLVPIAVRLGLVPATNTVPSSESEAWSEEQPTAELRSLFCR